MGLVKVIGDHPEDIASGRTVAPEEAFDAAELAPKPGADASPVEVSAYEHDKRLVDEGRIIEARITPVELEGDALQERARELGVEGRTTMSAPKLRRAVAEAEAKSSDGGEG